MAKTRTGRSNKKQKTTPMETLLEFKRQVEEVDVVEDQVMEEAEERVISHRIIYQQDDDENVKQVDEPAAPAVAVVAPVPVAPITVAQVSVAQVTMLVNPVEPTLITPPALRPTDLDLLLKSEQKYNSLHEKFLLLQALSHQTHLDDYKTLHQDQILELEKTIGLLQDERQVLRERLDNAPDKGLSPRRHQELLEQVEGLKSELDSVNEKSMELESTVKLYATKQIALQTEIKELQDVVESKTRDLTQVVQDRSQVVEELKNLTSLLTDQTALAKRLDDGYQKLKMEKSDLELALGQSNAALARVHAKELQEKLNEEVLYSQKLESICELAEAMTGITVQNLEVREKKPLEDSEEYEYSCFSIKQRGSSHFAYIPSEKLKKLDGLPDFLEGEIEFERKMLQEFFGNLKKFVDGGMADEVD